MNVKYYCPSCLEENPVVTKELWTNPIRYTMDGLVEHGSKFLGKGKRLLSCKAKCQGCGHEAVWLEVVEPALEDSVKALVADVQELRDRMAELEKACEGEPEVVDDA